METAIVHWGNIRVTLGLDWDNGIKDLSYEHPV